MSTLTKLASSMIGRLKPEPVRGSPARLLELPAPEMHGGLQLCDALSSRHSERAFRNEPLSLVDLSGLLWAADGINRPATGGRTAPSAMNAREVMILVALPEGVYRYEPEPHALELVAASDVRRLTGYQDLVDTAPVELIYVARHGRGLLVPASLRSVYAAASAGAMAQNVYLYCASRGLGCVVRGWFDRDALRAALSLEDNHELLFAQTVGHPAPAAPAAELDGVSYSLRPVPTGEGHGGG